MAQNYKKSLDLVGVKKRLKDYEQMLQYYTLMRTKNNRKILKHNLVGGCRGIFYKGIRE
jgi:hypothetical protein